MEQTQSDNKKPCLIQCGQGFCVSYQNRFLYSKYGPDRAVKAVIQNLAIAPDSLVLVCSPCLWLGLAELTQKLSDNCKIACLELDKELYSFAKSQAKDDYPPLFDNYNDILNYTLQGNFKRVVRVDFSAGTVFFKDQYDAVTYNLQQIVFANIKNRLTLVNFGRLFSKNVFKNLKSNIQNSLDLKSLFSTVTKPVLVCGAGESLDVTIRQLKDNPQLQDNLCIIAVDAALQCLLDNKIKVDAVVAVESQLAIEKAYIGSAKDCRVFMFCDLTSRAHVPVLSGSNTSFFLSEYADLKFFNRLERSGLLPPVLAPMGSVGLVAVDLALRLRKNEDIPVFVTGLDFSYSRGKTHAQASHAHKGKIFGSDRFNAIDNIAAACNEGTISLQGINGVIVFTTRNLKNYADLFVQKFSSCKNLFDARNQGIELNILPKDLTDCKDLKCSCSNFKLSDAGSPRFCSQDKVNAFINDERQALEKLKSLLSYGKDSPYYDNNIQDDTQYTSLQKQLLVLLAEREYLYIHFPDGQKLRLDGDFLKRIRIEIDFFLKEL